MGSHRNIASERWPEQGNTLGKRAEVVFHYDLAHRLQGTIVRDDIRSPWETIIQLDDGRFVRGKECQYRVLEGTSGQ
jgi:hypothetical protein